jgi:hypothetical protein
MPGRWDHSVNFADAKEFTFLENGTVAAVGRATWELKGHALKLHWPAGDAPRDDSVEQCVVAPNGKWYVGRNQQDAVIRGVRKD